LDRRGASDQPDPAPGESVVSTHSWNVLIESASLSTRLESASDERFALDQRLTPGVTRQP
jgi:hypothetical protein